MYCELFYTKQERPKKSYIFSVLLEDNYNFYNRFKKYVRVEIFFDNSKPGMSNSNLCVGHTLSFETRKTYCGTTV